MEDFPTWLPVVAIALFDDAGRVLMQQRASQKHHGGLWEFPGGKVEPAEKPREALVREITEELGVTLDSAQFQPAGLAEEEGDKTVVLLLYTTQQPATGIVPVEGQEWGWFALEEASGLPLAPMDRKLLSQLPR